MIHIDHNNPEMVALIGLLIERMIPKDEKTGLPGVNYEDFFKHLEKQDELKKFLLQFTELIKSIEDKRNFHLSQHTITKFLEDKDFKKGLTKYLGVALLDHYYLIQEVRGYYSQNIPAPFPKGNHLHALDLELLESVYLRGKRYREAEHLAKFKYSPP